MERGPLLLQGEGGMPEPLFMGRGMVLLGWQRGRGLVKGGLLYRPTSYEVISEPRRRPMEGGIG